MRELDAFLIALERRARRWLPNGAAEDAVAEAREHLENAMQARLEIDEPPERAELETLRAFGDGERFVRALAHAQWADRDLARRRWLVAIFAALGLAAALPWFLRPWPVGLCVLGYARASFLARRPAKSSLAFAMGLIVLLPMLYVVGLSNEGFGNASRILLYEVPRAALEPGGASAIDFLYEWRFVLFTLFAGTVGIDLLFGTLDCATHRCWRRVDA